MPQGREPAGRLEILIGVAEKSGSPRWFARPWAVPSGIAVLAFALFLVPIHRYALGWDEGFTFERLDALRPWLEELGRWELGLSDHFSAQRLARHWRFSREEPDSHGPFSALLSLAGRLASRRLLDPPASYRVGSIALLSITLGIVFATLRRNWSLWGAGIGTVLLATIPRVCPELCYALTDGPLVSLALLAWCAFVRAAGINRMRNGHEAGGQSHKPHWPATVGFGAAVGLAMATKLTGWFFLLPYVVWSADQGLRLRRWTGLGVVGLGTLVALAVLFTVNVGWWPDPIGGVRTYWEANLSRERIIPISILFLGTRYPFSLPWYNTAVWTVVAMPVSTLTLGLVGIGTVGRHLGREPFGMLLLLNWALLMLVRALPQAPGHDGTRQLVVSFAFLALLAGCGLESVAERAGRLVTHRWQGCLLAVIGCGAIGESATSIWLHRHAPLSYYSPLVGGLPGAVRLGFEATYFWDSLTPDVLGWLDDHTESGEWVLFRHNPRSFDYLSRWGYLRVPHQRPPNWDPPPRWFVIQNRPGAFDPADEWLLANRRPAYSKELFGVPLIRVYAGRDWLESQAQTMQGGAPE